MQFLIQSWKTLGVVLGAAGLLMGAVAGGIVESGQNAAETKLVASTEPAPIPETEHAYQLSDAFRYAADRVLPAVGSIETTGKVAKAPGQNRRQFPFGEENPFEGTPFEDFFKNPQFRGQFEGVPIQPRPSRGIGSGVIIDPSGIVLTNNHVVKDGAEVKVRLGDGREFIASRVATDPNTDLAIVQIDADGPLPTAPFGDSEAMEIGDWVLALGQPFGRDTPVTAGIISANHRGLGIAARENFLQTDAAINPGNSGGPLVNLRGEIVGINTAIRSGGGGNDGIGFAVPSQVAQWVSRQLIKSDSVRRAYLGVGIQPMTQTLAQQFGVGPREGVAVTQVYPDTPAAKAGLEPGDVVTAFAGKPVNSTNELQMEVERSEIGKPQELVVVRNGKELKLKLVPEEQPSTFGRRQAASEEPAEEEDAPTSVDGPLTPWGLELAALTPAAAEHLGLSDARGMPVLAVQPGSPAAEGGITEEMVIAQVNRKPVASEAELKAAVEQGTKDSEVLLLVKSSEGARFVVLKK